MMLKLYLDMRKMNLVELYFKEIILEINKKTGKEIVYISLCNFLKLIKHKYLKWLIHCCLCNYLSSAFTSYFKNNSTIRK